MKKYYKVIIIVVVFISIMTIFTIKKINTFKQNNDDRYIKYSTNGNVQEQKQEYKMYEFVSSSCISCKTMEPTYNKIVETYKDKMDFEVVNVNYNYNLSNKYKINVVPTFLIVDKEGNIIKKDIGEMEYEDMVQKINKVLESK